MELNITLTKQYQEKLERLSNAYEIPIDKLIKRLLSEEIKEVYKAEQLQDNQAFQVMVHSCVHPDEVQYVRTKKDLRFYRMAY